MQAEHVTYGPYSLVVNLTPWGRPLVIKRHDPDARERVVAFVDSMGDWDCFVAAMESGADEVAAVHEIDREA